MSRQAAVKQDLVDPTYSFVLVKHEGKSDLEFSLDQGSAEDLKGLLRRIRRELPEAIPV
jgi:hypothetical protein